MQVIQVVQGSPDWLKLRQSHSTASEAPAALGKSKYQTRSALMKQKSTGLTDDVDGAKQALFDRGHAAEAAARSIAEGIIGSDLYPVTATLTVDGIDLLASLDGATMDEEIIWEHKLFSERLGDDIRSGTLDDNYTIQMDQQLLVSGAKKCLFMASDGTNENMVWCWYESTQNQVDTLIAGWKQFHVELAAYVPTAPTMQAVAAPVESLPAVRVQLDGQLVVASNLPEFATALRAFIERIPAKPSTDQEFANCESACKSLKKAEDALESSETHALAQMTDVEAMRRMVADLRNLARATRLASEKSVAARKESIRGEIVADGAKAIAAHIVALNTRLGRPYMPTVPADFAGAIKGKRTVDSLRDAVNTALANAKISASAIADKIEANLTTLRELAKDYSFLFADTAQLVLKDTDTVENIIKIRIMGHKEAKAAEEEATRARIAEQERIKAEAAANAKAAAEIATAREADRAAAAKVEADKQAQDAITAAQATPVPAQVPAQPIPATVVVRRLMDPLYPRIEATASPEVPPTLKIGQINERLHPVQISAQGLSMLGFNPAGKAGASILFHESSFPLICAALVQHIQDVCQVAA